LSGGQQQLLCLARALALSSEVLLLDEPTSALDPGTTEHIEALLRSLRDTVTILIVTHNLGQAMRLSDDVVFLMAGKLSRRHRRRRSFTRPRMNAAGNMSAVVSGNGCSAGRTRQ